MSQIELDLSSMVFDKIANVLRSGGQCRRRFRAADRRPHNAEDRPKPESDHVDQFAATIKMRIDLGTVSSDSIVVPQKALLLKTVVTVPKSKNQMSRNKKEWAEQIAERTAALADHAVGEDPPPDTHPEHHFTACRGDVIPFRDKGDVMVDVSANGKECIAVNLAVPGSITPCGSRTTSAAKTRY